MSSSDDQPSWFWQNPRHAPQPGSPPVQQPMYPPPPPPPDYQYPYPPPYPYPYAYPPPRPQRTVMSTSNVILLLIALIGGPVVLSLLVSSHPGDSTAFLPTATPGPAAVGATLSANGLDCTLESVHTLAGDEIFQPKAGNTFIVVRVRLVNQSSHTVSYNEYDFHVKSSAGNVTGPEIPPSTYTANLMLDSGQLAAKGNVSGDIVFEVPVGDHGAELSWEPSFFSSIDDNVWNLGL